MPSSSHWASLVAQTVKHLPTMWETRVQSLGWEDLLEKQMATHSSILAWKIPWMEEPDRLQSMGLQRVGHDFTFTFTFIYKVDDKQGLTVYHAAAAAVASVVSDSV